MPSDEATRAYYDDFSRWYERDRGRGYHQLIDDLEVSVVEPLSRDKRVLEVGCGTGLILQRMARVARSAKGIDLSPGMLATARERGLDVVEGSATELPFADASFDVVYSFKVLAHVPEIARALGEMARVCAPGGYVVAEFYNPWSLRYLAKRFGPAGRVSETRDEGAVYTRFDSPREIAAMLPTELVLEAFRGVRVFTPVAKLVSVPWVGTALSLAERAAVASPLAKFGGFLIAVARRR